MTTEQSDTDLTTTLATVDPTPPKPGRAWTRTLGRWALAVIILGGLAYGVYLLWPSIDERFVQPISENTEGILNLTDRVNDLEARIAELESRTAEIVETDRTNTTGVAAVEEQFAQIEAQLDAQQARLEGLEDTAFALADADEEAAARTERELTVLRAMGLMSRARLSLYQANYGLAREDLVSARAVLEQISNPDATVTQVLDRLDTSVSALPDLPVSAAADLDIAWQLLVGDVALQATPTSAQTSTTASPSTTTTSTTQESQPEG